MAATARELNFMELLELKRGYLVRKLKKEGRTPSYGELRDAGSIPDDEIYNYYDNTVFSDNDFYVNRVMENIDLTYTGNTEEGSMSTITLEERIRQINPNVIKADGSIQTFKEQLFDLDHGQYDFRYPMVISLTSEYFEYLGNTDNEKPVVINPNKVLEITGSHALKITDLAELKELVVESGLAFDSLTHETSRVIVLDKEDDAGDRVIAVMRLDAEATFLSVNRISSVYGKERFVRFVERTYDADKMFYCNEKTEDFTKSPRLQLPNGLVNALSMMNYTGSFNKSQVEEIEKTEQDVKNTRLQLPNSLTSALHEDNIKDDIESQGLINENDRVYTLEEILDRAENAPAMSRELRAKDESLVQLASWIEEETGINPFDDENDGYIDSAEEYILKYIEDNNVGVMFSTFGNIESIAAQPHREFFVEDQIAEREDIDRMYEEEELHEIVKVSENELGNIIENREPIGLFYAVSEQDNRMIWTAVDNTEGDAWTEDFTSFEGMKEWLYDMGEQMENDIIERADQNQKKIHISLGKNYCFSRESEATGKVYNQMTIPNGTMLDGRDIGGSKICPKFMGVSKFNHNEMVATYYVPEDRPLKVKLITGTNTEMVDIEKLKEAVDNQKAAYIESIRQQELEMRKSRDQGLNKTKERGEEIE